MLKQFKNRIDWEALSLKECDIILTPDCLEQFADYWDWFNLSGNGSLRLDYDMIDRFIDKWDWAELINHYCWMDEGASRLNGYEFLERYASRIPADALEDSQLWYLLKEDRKKELQRQILSGEL